MIYNINKESSVKEYVGSANTENYKITVYKENGFFKVHKNGIHVGNYPTDKFTVMEAMHLSVAGCYFPNNFNYINKTTLRALDHVRLTNVDIPENSEWEYRLDGGNYYDL